MRKNSPVASVLSQTKSTLREQVIYRIFCVLFVFVYMLLFIIMTFVSVLTTTYTHSAVHCLLKMFICNCASNAVVSAMLLI